MRLSHRQHKGAAPLAWMAWLLLLWAHVVHPVHSAQKLSALTAETSESVVSAEVATEPERRARGPYDCPHHEEHAAAHPHGHHTHGTHPQAGAAAHDHEHEPMYCPHCTVGGLFWLPVVSGAEPAAQVQHSLAVYPGPPLAPARPAEYPQQPRAPPV